MTSPATTVTSSSRPSAPGHGAATPLRQRMQKAWVRWWLRQCRHAERKDRFVPYY